MIADNKITKIFCDVDDFVKKCSYLGYVCEYLNSGFPNLVS